MVDSAPIATTPGSPPVAQPTSVASAPASIDPRRVLLSKILLVLAVIGILSVVFSLLLNPYQRRVAAEDTQRRTDLVDMRNALENYAATHGGIYPSTHGEYWCENCTYPDYHAVGADNWIPELVKGGFIESLPTDPANLVGTTCRPDAAASFAGYVYYSPSPPNNNNYKLLAQCTPPGSSLNQGDAAPTSPFCSSRPPYDSSNLTIHPFRDNPLREFVDPVRYDYAYAIYTPGLACL